MTTTTTRRTNTLRELRSLAPARPLSFGEAHRVAELQANRLLSLSGWTLSPVPEAIITSLSRVAVTYDHRLTRSGATCWAAGAWRIRICANEPPTRQRFTLAHEFKHVLDAANEDALYGHLPHGPARDRQIEAICDHFAACLLMPRAWVKRLWGDRHQDTAVLASQFEVSQQAMDIRLQVLGLIPPRRRCAYDLGRVAVRASRRPQTKSRHRYYYRTASRPTPLHGVAVALASSPQLEGAV